MEPIKLKNCNLAYLFELAKGDMEFVREMIQVFVEESATELAALRHAIERGDFEQIRQTAHKLRSSIPYVGLDLVIGDDVAEIEDLAKEEQGINAIKDNFRKISLASADAVDELKELNI